MRRLLRRLLPGGRRQSARAAAPLSIPPLSPTDPPAPVPGLWPAVLATSDAATASGALATTPTAATAVADGGWTFVVRVAASLKAKADAAAAAAAKADKEKADAKPKKRFNPFDPPDARLVVALLPPAHTLVLNKFNVATGHVLIVTSAFEPQEAPLTPADAAAAWAVVTSLPGAGGVLYFNRGPLSGASQPHKHLQVVPLPLHDGDVVDGDEQTCWAPFERAALAAVEGVPPLTVAPVRSLPVQAFAAAMPPGPGPTPTALAACFAALAAACGVPGGVEDTGSYNLVLTRRAALAVPRAASGTGPVGVNAIGYAGSLLVRSDDEQEFVKREGPWGVLAACGVKW